MSASLPAWPPQLSAPQLEALSSIATDYALSHGLVYRPPLETSSSAPRTDSVIHAPFSLLPSPFPRALFEKAQALQPLYNDLYARVTVDHAFLRKVIGGSVAQVDEFQRELWRVWEQAEKEGLVQPLQLGLFRSDYLMHASPSGEPELKQVEFNTISSSFGPLCARVSDLHRQLYASTSYYGVSPHLSSAHLPENQSLSVLVAGLAAAHKAYLESAGSSGQAPVILFVVQDGERNAFDQRWLEYELLQSHSIRVRRASFAELEKAHKLDGPSRRLLLTTPSDPSPLEISVVYYRSGYGPGDYPTPSVWDTRLSLELSLAIKCPSISLQLAGAKKVQQVLAEPGVAEDILASRSGAADLALLRSSFAALYPLDDSPLGKEGQRLARESPESFVMKPQREGGGNNIYRLDIPPALDAMEARDAKRGAEGPREREGYILMSLIVPAAGIGNYLIRAGAGASSGGAQSAGPVLADDVVSELGVYGTALFGPGKTEGASPDVRFSNAGGYLLRTKGRESDEGGVAVGFSVIDSPVLV